MTTATQTTAPQSRPIPRAATRWQIDPAHSSANFTIRHMMIAKVHGGFTRLQGSLDLDREDLSRSSVRAEIDAASIDTREPKRDEHLRSADFFDVAKYPTVTFASREFRQGRDGLEIVGDLTLHGVTREVVLAVEGLDTEMKDPWGNLKLGASATTRIKRKDFGLEWNAALEAGGVLVGDDVTINLEVQFTKQA